MEKGLIAESTEVQEHNQCPIQIGPADASPADIDLYQYRESVRAVKATLVHVGVSWRKSKRDVGQTGSELPFELIGIEFAVSLYQWRSR